MYTRARIPCQLSCEYPDAFEGWNTIASWDRCIFRHCSWVLSRLVPASMLKNLFWVGHRVMLVDAPQHSEKLVVKVVPMVVPGVTEDHARNCFRTSRQLGQVLFLLLVADLANRRALRAACQRSDLVIRCGGVANQVLTGTEGLTHGFGPYLMNRSMWAFWRLGVLTTFICLQAIIVTALKEHAEFYTEQLFRQGVRSFIEPDTTTL